MGEVYKARDSRLERVVAVKVIHPILAANPELRQRFEREARTISQLTHPNICALYDIGEAPPDPKLGTHAAVRYLVLEYCDGQTLAERLLRGPLPISQALRVGAEICDALHRAHSAGIVHRDLKPGNVMLTGDGAKLLDFGLARPGVGFIAGPGPLSPAPITALPITAEGALIGTFQYMSPEQIEGAAPDVRSDIWAFGCVLYEMVTGRRAFEGKSQTSVIAAILEREPEPLTAAQPEAPPLVDAIVRACLAKSPADRIQSAHDVGLQLEWIAQGSAAGSGANLMLPRRRTAKLPWAVAATAAAAALALSVPAYRHLRRDAVPPRPIITAVPAPDNSGFTPADRYAVSTDGTAIAFTSSDPERLRSLWVRRFDNPAPTRIAGLKNPAVPFWSPSGDAVAVFDAGSLAIVTLADGSVRRVATADGFLADWGTAGQIVFLNVDGGLSTIRADGTGLRVVAAPDATKGEQAFLTPVFLPDGDRVIYTVEVRPTPSHETRFDVRVLSIASGKSESMSVPGRIVGLDDGSLLYSSADGILYAQTFDTRSLTLSGEPRRVYEWSSGPVSRRYTVAGGVLAYRGSVNTSLQRLTWFDRAGRVQGQVGGPNNYSNPALSPDGRRLAVGMRATPSAGRDIWVFDLARDSPIKLTHDEGDDFNPVWSPDGSRIAFSGVRFGQRNIYIVSSSGLGGEEMLVRSDRPKAAEAWSTDGRFLFFSEPGQNSADISALDMQTGRQSRILEAPFGQSAAAISPDGRLLAYQSDENGPTEVFLRTFPGSEGKWQVSTAGGIEPAWRRDGRELFFVAGDDLMAVAISPGKAGVEVGRPQRLFSQRLGPVLRNRYVASPDGQRFLMNVPVTDRTTEPITVILNWRGLPQ